LFYHVQAHLRQDPNDKDLYHYTEFDIFDMKGYIPARLLNMILASETEKEFKKFYDFISFKK
jgi:hypothetical protein